MVKKTSTLHNPRFFLLIDKNRDNLSKIFIVCFAASFQIIFSSFLYAKPYIPNNDAIVLQKLPASGDSKMQAIRQLRNDWSESPNDLKLAVELARRYLEMARSMADPRYEGYAQAALQFWWNMSQPPPEVLILRATLRQRQHDFKRALSDLERALQIQPNNAQAWLTRAVIYQVQGDYSAAHRSCLPLLRLSDNLLATTCIANVASLNGRAQESYQALRKAIEKAPVANSTEKLWALTILAETAERLGKYPEAEQYYQLALNVDQTDYYLLGAYSDFLLDQHRPEDVENLLRKTNQSDALLLRLALAAHQLNTPELQSYIETLKSRFAVNRLRGEAQHLREEARFTLHLLHQPKQALELAVENWRIQREPWDARILLEAALQQGDREAALPVLNWLKSVNLEDVQLEKLSQEFS